MSRTRSIGLHAVELGPLAPAKRPKLRVGSAVAQHGIFKAEGSFELQAFKNGFHKSFVSHDPSWVGPWYSPTLGLHTPDELRSVQFPAIAKTGNAEIRYALYQAAMVASVGDKHFVAYFSDQLRGREKEKGIKTKKRVKLAAKIMMIAWTLMKKQERFDPKFLVGEN